MMKGIHSRRERKRERIKSISNGTTLVALLKFSGSKKTPFRFRHRFSLDHEVHPPLLFVVELIKCGLSTTAFQPRFLCFFLYEIHLSLCAYNCIATSSYMILNHLRLARNGLIGSSCREIISCEITILVKTDKFR